MLVKDEIKSEDIGIYDIKALCLEIAYNDKKAHRMFDSKKIKPKYTEDIGKVYEELEKAIDSGDIGKVDKLLDKFSRVVDRYKKLKPSLNISSRNEGTNEYTYSISEVWNDEKGNIASLGRMLSFAKQNTKTRMRERKQEEKERKEYEIKEKIYGDIGKSAYEKMKEANERQAREEERASIRRAIDGNSFEAETRGKVESDVEMAKKIYGDSDSGRAYKETKKARDSMPDYMKE